jgi:hypothetical protein
MSDITTEGLQGITMATAAWTGTPTVLKVNDQVTMPQTPNGTVIVSAINQATLNNQGEASITSGGSQVESLELPALATAPTAYAHNYGASNLAITNTSAQDNTPIQVQAVGPGIPGVTPKPLVILTPLTVGFGEVAQGGTNPQNMQLKIQNNTSTTSVVGVIGGPADASGSNGKIIAVNWPAGTPVPPEYFAVSNNNTYTLNFNWNGQQIFVGNLSSSNAAPVVLTLRAL